MYIQKATKLLEYLHGTRLIHPAFQVDGNATKQGGDENLLEDQYLQPKDWKILQEY